ncbi:hypothetical protein [Sphingobacterium corticibacter]|uniref:Uncharacterized protein n=1 Tax=Sphingobacterium corticibacter TaxID=2171749 RepID=A0A2T8HNS4_9SPHI|nr:hypothetical protein [Sphingobacterium corticibacter]PVH27060.1 hypothetical protein DC487_05535 [Sphingobacterium corticibacter]
MNIILLQSSSNEVLTFLAAIAISILLFFVFRSVLLWYWRVDEIVKNQQKQIQQQQTIIEGLAGLYKSMNRMDTNA